MTSVYIPPVIRFCHCSKLGDSLYFLVEFLYTVSQPLNYASLAVFQLLLIKGKKHLVSYISVTGAVIFCVGIAILVALEGVTLKNLADQTYVCYNCLGMLTQRFHGLEYSLLSFLVFSYFPSFFTVFICTSWSCCIFKKAYIGDSGELT